MTNSAIPLETRRALGIADSAIVLLADHVPIESEPMAGATLTSLAPLLAWLLLGAGSPPKQEPESIPSDATRAVRLRIERYRSVDESGTQVDVICIFDDRGRHLKLGAVGTTHAPQVQVSDEFSAGVVALPAGSGAVVGIPSGEKLIIHHGVEGIDYELSLDSPSPLPVWPPSPVEAWSQVINDPSIIDILRDMQATDEGWDTVVAAGVFARLMPSAGDPLSVDSILSGDVRRPYASWFRTLNKEHLAYLTDYALIAAATLSDELHFLLDDFRPFEAEWVRDYVAACRRREELEGVCAVLGSIGASDVLRTRLNILDESTSPFIMSFASVVVDPVLSKVSTRDPTAWWGAIGTPRTE